MHDKSASSNSSPAALEAFLTRAGTKERTKIEKHLALIDAEGGPEHGAVFRRIAIRLGELAPVGVQSVGSNNWRYFIPDGKYRKQVFALEDPGDGTLRIYLPDIRGAAVKAKILKATGEPNQFNVAGTPRTLYVEPLDAESTASPAAHFKHMLGWNRTAVRVTLPILGAAEGPLAAATDALCALAAKEWAGQAAAQPEAKK
jgi:hypothetical protein